MRDSGAYDSDYSNVSDGKYYYGSDYSRVCTLGTKDLPGFYKDHWLIDSGASDDITSYFVTKHFASLVSVIPDHSRKQSPLPAG